MRRPPPRRDEKILDRGGAVVVLLLGGYIGAATFGLYVSYGSAGVAQTAAFTAIIVLEKFNVFNFRSLREPMHRIGWFSNPWILAAWASMIGLQVAAVYVPFLQEFLHTVPLRGEDWLRILAVSLPIFLVVEGIKVVRGRA